jgi:radical SAM superfamily enzyme YgiQ (UPF0313 family)
MSSRILLISANRCTAPDPVFPLGLAYLNAALRRAGHDCMWLDALSHRAELREQVRNFRPDYVGISLRNIDDVLIRKQETFFAELTPLIAELREATTSPIILGGSGFSIFPRQLFELSGADFGIVGEGETALPALVESLSHRADVVAIPGLVFRHQDRTIVNPPWPHPASETLLAADRPPSVTAHYLENSGALNIQTQRGCAFRCCYCTYPVIEGRQHRRRSAEMVAAEFEQLQQLGARYAFVVDSVFNSSAAHVTGICEAILRRNVKIPWGCFLRPQGLSRDLMHLMARAGLTHIEFGSDSFCDDVLSEYQKDFSFEDIRFSSELARQAGIDFCHYLIAGGPSESQATLLRTFENSRCLGDPIVIAVVGMRIYPGTALFERAVVEGRISPDANLLTPHYYLAPGLQPAQVFQELQGFAWRSPNWIVGDPEPSYSDLVARLRRRGLAGPLWSYLSIIQHIRPSELATGHAAKRRS